MKDSRTLLLLFVSVLLILASITLLWSWGYQFTFKRQQNIASVDITSANTTNKARLISDSLQKAYYNTLNHLDKTIDSVFNKNDSLKGNLDVKLSEFYQLRNQITDSFNNRSGDTDIKLASQKISQLQQRIIQLRISNTDVENENKRLSSLLKQYTNSLSPVTDEPKTMRTASSSVKPFAINNSGEVFTATDLQMVAQDQDKNSQEPLEFGQPLRLAGSFVVKNKSRQSNSIEIMIVVLQPNGKVLQKSSWESGAFQTNSGNKIYSCKLQAACNSGEAKRLQFSLNSDEYQKGNYSMQVYHNGVIIAKITKSLT